MTTHQDMVYAIGALFTAETAGAGVTVFQTKNGPVKFHSRPNADGYVVEVKGEPTIVTGTHFGIESTVDAKPSTETSAAGIRGIGGIGRLKADYTMTGGSLIGAYGQACNDGTINGSGAMVAGLYGLIEDGGVYTAVSHLSAAWLDSHLTKTVSAGIKDFLYVTNNGTTQFDNVLYVYAGEKITNLLTIESTKAGDLVSAATTADYTFTKTRKIKVNVGGETGYLIVDIV
jgi:hypothetical protein